MLKKIGRLFAANPLDQKLKQVCEIKRARILVTWNRGLGDIPLGLYAIVYRIRERIPEAEITFLTRKDLEEGFRLLEGIKVVIAPHWQRGVAFNLASTFSYVQLSQTDFDLILDNPDPTYWVKWQLGKLTPKLNWNPAWDSLCDRFHLNRGAVGVHVQTETLYGYEKNWPVTHWQELFTRLVKEKGLEILLFGFKKEGSFSQKGIVDLRGETTLLEMLSIIKNRCAYLVVPDSGVLSITYYLDVDFPIQVVSLWADPRQGVLKQKVLSPNKNYRHHPLYGRKEDVARISVDEVIHCLC